MKNDSRQNKKRSRIIAFVISILCPGSGQIYNYQIKKGFFIYIIYLISSFIIVVTHSVMYKSFIYFIIVIFLGVFSFALMIYAVTNAVKNVREIPTVFFTRSHRALLFFGCSLALLALWLGPDQLSSQQGSTGSYSMPAKSMAPTLLPGEYFFTWESYYKRHEPRRGDIAIFYPFDDPDTPWVKRVVGLPGDQIQLLDGILHINGSPVLREPAGEFVAASSQGEVQRYRKYVETLPGGISHFIVEISDKGPFDNTSVYTVPLGHYFVMGDNRDSSRDSRFLEALGYIPRESFRDLVTYVYWPAEFDRLGVLVQALP